MTVDVYTEDLAVCAAVEKPIKNLTESSRVRLLKNVFVTNDSPYVQRLPTGGSPDRIDFIVSKNLVNYGKHSHSLLGPKNCASNRFTWEGESEILWQGGWQYGGLSSKANFVRRCVSGIQHCRLPRELSISGPILIERGAHFNTDIGPHLLGTSFSSNGYTFHANFSAGTDALGSFFHGGGQSGSLPDGTFHGLRLVRSSLYGLAQTSSLQAKDDRLNQGHQSKEPGGDDQPKSEFDQVPIVRRFIFAVFGLLDGFFLSLRGWQLFDNKRRLLGAALIGIGWVLGRLGLGLW